MIRLITVNGNLYEQYPHYKKLVQPGMGFGGLPNQEPPLSLPIQSVNYHVQAFNSILKTKIGITYINDSETKIEALLEMPSNPDIVISKMSIKVGDREEIRGVVKDKQKAHEQYEDAVAAGHQAAMLENKEKDESVLQLRVGNIDPGQVIKVDITLIEQAKIFEGTFQINIPRGIMFLLTETKENSHIQIDINSTSPIANIFSPKILKKTELGKIKTRR